VYAIWDTGASQTVITHRLMSQLNLIPIETKVVHGITSKQTVDFVIPPLPEQYNLTQKAAALNNPE
jgi:hypothetical protein